MLTRRKVLVGLQCLVALLLVLGASPAFGDSTVPENGVPERVESAAGRLASGLEQQGFDVAPGYFKLYTRDDCPMSYDVLGSCLGNNPAAPYVLPLVPPWPDEWVDPGLIGAVGEAADGYGGSFRFDNREAIVILGVLPPPAAYLGLHTYLVSREGTFSPASLQYWLVSTFVPYLVPVFFAQLPWNESRVQLFASMDDSINDVVVARQSDAVWNQLRYFIITPDQSMDLAVRQALAGMDVEAKDIFTEPIPGDRDLGLGESADDFWMVMRYAMPVDGGAAGTPSDRWLHAPSLVVMRVRDASSGAEPLPYPKASLETRTAFDEKELQSQRDLLVAGVRTRWEQPEAKVTGSVDLQSQLLEVGPECATVGMNCLADNQDSAVQMTRGRLSLDGDPQPVYAVVSTLGTETGNATYVGLGLNNSLKQLGIGNVSDRQLKNSARGYGLAMPDAKKFFVYYFTRDCSGLEDLTGGYCFSIPETMLPKCDDPADLTCELLVFSLRDYIYPGTQGGPDSGKVLSLAVVWLHRPQD
jgi:hypothetical protein